MLHQTREIIFASDLSDSSRAAIPAVSRWVESFGARLTLLHVHDPALAVPRAAKALLDAFFAEARSFARCDRVLLHGDPAAEIASYCESRGNMLLMLPPGDLAGRLRPWRRSLRARLIRELRVPIWTLGRAPGEESTVFPHRHIGVWLSRPEEGLAHLQQAVRYASETGSTLHLLHIMDESHGGSLLEPLRGRVPFSGEKTDLWLRQIASTLDPRCRVEVHTAQGRVGSELPRLIARSGVSLLLASQQAVVRNGWRGPTIHPALGRCPINLVAVPVDGGHAAARSRQNIAVPAA